MKFKGMEIVGEYNVEYGMNFFKVYDKNGNKIYYEDINDCWEIFKHDANGNNIYYEDSSGNFFRSEYDKNGNRIYLEDENGKR